MPRQKKAEVDLTAVLSGLSKTLERIEKKLESISLSKEFSGTTLKQAMTDTVEDLAERAKRGPEQPQTRTLEATPDTYFPPEYREAVDQVLNRHFGASMGTEEVGPGYFSFVIETPKKYQNVPEIYLQSTGGKQLHVRAVETAHGLTGIRDWAEKVFKSFDITTQTLIVSDRVNLAV